MTTFYRDNLNIDSQLQRALDIVQARDLLEDFGAVFRSGRCQAFWRGGDGYNISCRSGFIKDFASGESYSCFSWLVECMGYSKAEAAKELIARAGLSDERPVLHMRRRAAQAQPEVDAPSYYERLFAQAPAATPSEASEHPYARRKGISEHVIARVVNGLRLQDGWLVVPFVNIETLASGAWQGLASTGTKRFGGSIGGCAAVFWPVAVEQRWSALKTAMLRGEAGVAICEGVATGASIAQARPELAVLCAGSAAGLEPAAVAVRRLLGGVATVDGVRHALDITIYSDNDQKADGSNPGLEAAHKAAINANAYVAKPADMYKVSDFNDLQQEHGLEAVAHTRRSAPDASLAFAKMLRKLQSGESRDIAPLTCEAGEALIVRAPQGTGKTKAIANLLNTLDSSILCITHLVSLADNLAARLGIHSYRDMAHVGEYRTVSQLAICFDSLRHLAGSRYDTVVIDEIEQVLRHLKDSSIKHKQDNLAAFISVLHNAKRIICADADAGAITERFLRLYAPHLQQRLEIHHFPVLEGVTVRMVADEYDVLEDVIRCEVPSWYATDSLRKSRDLAAYLEANTDTDSSDNIMLINSETSSQAAQQRYIANPTEEATQYDRVIASPSVRTGVSDESNHWQAVYGNFSGAQGIPEDAMQALLRARGVPEISVYVPNTKRSGKNEQELFEQYLAAEQAERPDREPDVEYLRSKAVLEAHEANRRRSYRQDLAKFFVRLGATVIWEVPKTLNKSANARRKQLKDDIKAAGLDKYIKDRINAPVIDEARAKQLRQADSLSQEEQFSLQAFEARDFFCLDPDDKEGLAEWLERDNYGKYRQQIERLELGMYGAPDIEDDSLDSSYKQLQALFFDEVLRFVKRFENGEFTSQDIADYWIPYVEFHYDMLKPSLGKLLPDKPDKDVDKLRPGAWLGAWLRAMGLKLEKVGQRYIDGRRVKVYRASNFEAHEALLRQRRQAGKVSPYCLLLDSLLSNKVITAEIASETALASEAAKTIPRERSAERTSQLARAPQWLEHLIVAYQRGAFDTSHHYTLLGEYIERALQGDSSALESLGDDVSWSAIEQEAAM